MPAPVEAKPPGSQLRSGIVDGEKAIEDNVISVSVSGPVSQGVSALDFGKGGRAYISSGILRDSAFSKLFSKPKSRVSVGCAI